MLRRVVLLVHQNILQKAIAGEGSTLSVELQEHGIEMVLQGSGSSEDTSAGAGVQEDGIMDSSVWMRVHRALRPDVPDRETLYITDSETGYQALCRQGCYVLPYRHGENKNADFAGALYVIEKIEEVGFETVDMAYRRLAGLPWEILTTKRCIIRETIVEDVESFYQIYANPEITRYMEDLYADQDEEIAYIREYQKSVYAFYGYGMWTVLTKDGTVIGRAGISWREGFELPELGFVIGMPWQGQGYAYEVCSAILAYAKEELGFTQVQALVMEGNEKSAALCRKLGFEREEDIVLEGEGYAVYRNDRG